MLNKQNINYLSMNKIFTKAIFMLCMFLVTGVAVHAQSIIVSGTVTDKLTKEPIPGVSVTVKGKTIGSSTDSKGQFSFSTVEKLPLTVVVSYIGFTTVERDVTTNTTNLTFELESGAILGQEVVISASRTPERILESPVSIERISSAALKELPAPSFYDALNNLKGVEMSTQSLTFKSVNTRGFNANGNVRFNQYIDGMDNQAPGLNFSVGNIVGLTELDVDNVELLPGAASALYGAGGINGTLLMTSKNPYQYQGASFQYKGGINHVNDNASGTNVQEYKQFDLRLAKSWNNKFGFKTAFSYLQARDWAATDNQNFDRISRVLKGGDRTSDMNYDGVNVYGDEVNTNLRGVGLSLEGGTRAQIMAAAGGAFDPRAALGAIPVGTPYANYIAAINTFPIPAALKTATINSYLPLYFGINTPGVIPNSLVSRTGYAEADLVNYDAKSLKTSTSLHYRFNNTVEAIAQANWGTGTSVYTGTGRYSLKNFKIGQYKLELKGQDFFLRAYTTQERSGDAYNVNALATFINEAWRPSQDPVNPLNGWFVRYYQGYLASKLGGQPEAAAQAAARANADVGRAIPGTAAFGQLKEETAKKFVGRGGAKFDDKTNLYHYEGMYNLSSLLKNVVDLQVGASYRDYYLHSGGTIFDDATRDIIIGEYGAYAQLAKKFGENFKMTVAGRYDKSSNFEGRLTPRITGVWTVAKNNNIRASFQTGYRNPTTQDQYIDLEVVSNTRLVGGIPEILNKYNLYNNKGVTAASYKAYQNAQAGGTSTVGILQNYTFDSEGLRPESVKSFELGYKGLANNRLLIDAYVYYNIFNDFIAGIDLVQDATTATPKNFNVPVNVTEEVKSYGAAFGLDYQVGKFNFNGNTSYNKLSDVPSTFDNNFNTPEWRFNVGVGSKEIIKNFGFNVQYRWQDKFVWSSTFATGPVAAYGTVDAQVNLKVPSVKSVIKLGGSNIANKYYMTSFGNPSVGGLYYLSYTFNP
jgi:outer membrane receptor protein involved in Fe transport